MCLGAAFCAHLPVSYPYTVLYYTKISRVTTHRGRVVVTRVSGNRLVTFRHLEKNESVPSPQIVDGSVFREGDMQKREM